MSTYQPLFAVNQINESQSSNNVSTLHLSVNVPPSSAINSSTPSTADSSGSSSSSSSSSSTNLLTQITPPLAVPNRIDEPFVTNSSRLQTTHTSSSHHLVTPSPNVSDLEGLSPHIPTNDEIDLLAYHEVPTVHEVTPLLESVSVSPPGLTLPSAISSSVGVNSIETPLLVVSPPVTSPSNGNRSLHQLHIPTPSSTTQPTDSSSSTQTPKSTNPTSRRSTKSTVGRFEVLEQESSPAATSGRAPSTTPRELDSAPLPHLVREHSAAPAYGLSDSPTSGSTGTSSDTPATTSSGTATELEYALSPISPTSAQSSASVATRVLGSLNPIASQPLQRIREDDPGSSPSGGSQEIDSANVNNANSGARGVKRRSIHTYDESSESSSSDDSDSSSDEDGTTTSTTRSHPHSRSRSPVERQLGAPAPLQLPISPSPYTVDASTRSTLPPISSSSSHAPLPSTARTTTSGRFSIVEFQTDDDVCPINSTASTPAFTLAPTHPRTSPIIHPPSLTVPLSSVGTPASLLNTRRRASHILLESVSQLHTDLALLINENESVTSDARLLASHVVLLRAKLEQALAGQLAVDVAREALKVTEMGNLEHYLTVRQTPQPSGHLNHSTISASTSTPTLSTQNHAQPQQQQQQQQSQNRQMNGTQPVISDGNPTPLATPSKGRGGARHKPPPMSVTIVSPSASPVPSPHVNGGHQQHQRSAGKNPGTNSNNSARGRGRSRGVSVSSPSMSPVASPPTSRPHSPRTPHSARKHHQQQHHGGTPNSTQKHKLTPHASPKLRSRPHPSQLPASATNGSNKQQHFHHQQQQQSNGSSSARSASSSSFANRLASTGATSDDPLDALASKCLSELK